MQYLNTTAIDAVNEGRDMPDAFYHKTLLIATSKYRALDGWRGYHEIIAEPGFKLLDSSWLTGDWDDAPDGHASADVETQIANLEAKHGEIWVIFTPTSNVFSTSYDVLIRDPETKINRGKAVAKATRRFDEPDGSFRLRYHATDVVKYDASRGVYTLNTGGWNTMTTGRRMTDALPSGWYVYRRDWVMYLGRPGEAETKIEDGMEVQA
jgi:hypothetical protein